MKNIVTITLLLVSVFSQAQRFDWATSGGYTGVANSFYGAIDIATDPQGNIYTMDVGFGQQQCQGDTIQPFSGYTTFIYKFNPLGVLEFINRVGVPGGGTFSAFNIETDDDGNLYLLGQPNGVGAVIVNNDTVTAVPHTNIMIKMDVSGNYLWSVNTGFAGNGDGCMLQYHDGNLYYQSGPLTTRMIDTNGNISDFSITASYYSSPTSSTGLLFKGSAVFNNGDLLFAAYSRGTVAYGTDTLYHIGNPFLTAPVLLLRCDAALNLVWARYLSNARDPDQNFIPVTTDADDNSYTVLQVNYQMIIGTDTVNNPENIFIGIGAVVKTDSNGDDIWAKRIDDNGKALAWSILRSDNGNSILIGGGYTGNAQIGPFTLNNGTNSKPFIASFDSEGTFNNAFNYLNEPTGSDASCLANGGNGNYLVGGKLPNNATPVFSCTPRDPNKGFYLGKFTEEPDVAPQPEISISGSVLTASPSFNGDIQWFLNGDSIPGANSQSYTVAVNGIYSVSYSYIPACVSFSEEINFSTLYISEIQTSPFTIYPNPFRDEITVELYEIPESTIMTIFELSGRKIFQTEISGASKNLALGYLTNGVYILQLCNSKQTSTKRVIKKD
ncbi:MAG: T9SS type A sorting domain-containing protein [Bacteroidota bacterium]